MNSQESRSGAQTTQGNWRERLYNPYTVMWLVVLMYTIKVATKLSAGYLTNSPVFISDGYHNLSDILQAFAVMVVVYMARRPPNTDYPL
ncbi:MAG TPA: cation transporter, partial [Candidatus Obscuribacter sp.]|nr:cation transporter [Candidatus Obscuribacter sp.]